MPRITTENGQAREAATNLFWRASLAWNTIEGFYETETYGTLIDKLTALTPLPHLVGLKAEALLDRVIRDQRIVVNPDAEVVYLHKLFSTTPKQTAEALTA